MTQAPRSVRRRRSAFTVGVTGAARPLGEGLVERLREHPSAPKVIAIDTTRRTVPGVTWRVADTRDPELAARLAGVNTVVHLATERSTTLPAEQRREINIEGTERVLDAAIAAGVQRVVLLTSAMVYGAHPANSIPLPEDAPLGGEPLNGEAGNGVVDDWVAMERAALERAASAELEVTVVRPASLVGPVADPLLPGMFEAVRLLAIRDGECHWQFCHVEDLLDALVAASLGEVSGAVTVGSDGWLTHAEVERISGLRSVVLRSSVAFAAASRLHRAGTLASPSSDLLYLVHPWVVGSQQLKDTGWQPRWSNEDALRDHLDRLGDRAGRSLVVLDRDGATRAAAGAAAGAGATLAIVGAFALAWVRRQR